MGLDCSKEYDLEYVNLYNGVCPSRTIDDLIELIEHHGRLPVNYSLIALNPSDNEYELTEAQTRAFASTHNIGLFDAVSGIGCDPKDLNCKLQMINSLCIIYGYDLVDKNATSLPYYEPLRSVRKLTLTSALVGFFDDESVSLINQLTYDELTDFAHQMAPAKTYESMENWSNYRTSLPQIINDKMLQWAWMEIDECMIEGDIVREIMSLPSGCIPGDISIQLSHNYVMGRIYIARKTTNTPTFEDFVKMLQTPSIFKHIILTPDDEHEYVSNVLEGNNESEIKTIIFLVSKGLLCYSLIDLVKNGLVTKHQYDNDIRVRNIIETIDRQEGSPTGVVKHRLLYNNLKIDWSYTIDVYDPLSLELYDVTQEDAIGLKMRFITNNASNFGPIDTFLLRYPKLDIKYFVVKKSAAENTKIALEHALKIFPEESTTAKYFYPGLTRFMDRPFDEFTSDILFSMFANTYHLDSKYYPPYYVGQPTISQPSMVSELALSLNCVCPIKWKPSSNRIMKQIIHVQKVNTIDYQTFTKQLNINGKQMLDIAMVSNEHTISNNLFLESWLTSDNGNFELMKDHKQLPEMVKAFM